VTHFGILALVLFGVAWYFMAPVERARLLRVVLAALRDVKNAVTLEGLRGDSFFDALRARTPRVIAMPSLIVLSATIFLLMAFNPGAGPGATSGEWWRLAATMFVHSGVLDLAINVVCLFQIGVILERLVGPLAFTLVYVAAGVAARSVGLFVSPAGMNIGPSGSVLGMYGLLLVTSIWSAIHRSSLTIPLNVTKRVAPVAAIFVIYKLTTGVGNVAQLTPLVCGLVGGIVVARDVNERTPPIRRLSAAMAIVLAIVAVYAVAARHRPLSETTDVRPEIERVIAVEGRTTSLYDDEVDLFRKGRSTAAALATMIEQTIVPELHVVAGRLRALHDVPPEHQSLIATAEEFLKLRDESWQLRAAALHKADMTGLRLADRKAQASLEAFHRVKMPLPHESARPAS
jgi:membrane associated rhomboid family serine protease